MNDCIGIEAQGLMVVAERDEEIERLNKEITFLAVGFVISFGLLVGSGIYILGAWLA